MPLKLFMAVAVTIICFFGGLQEASGEEAYSINGNQVLLYKVINWWYDCLPEESDRLCGQILSYRSFGNTQVDYNDEKEILTVYMAAGFTDMMSIFNPDAQGGNAPFLKCTRLNEKIFENAAVDDITGFLSVNGRLSLKDVKKDWAANLYRMKSHIGIEVKGRIHGLLNGRIALHPQGDFLKFCPRDDRSEDRVFIATLSLYHVEMKEVLAVLSLYGNRKSNENPSLASDTAF